MKKLSETLTELGIAFSFPIEIEDTNGNETYLEYSDGDRERYEYDANGRQTYCEDSNGFWQRWERDSKGRPIYHEDSNDFWSRWDRDANGDVDYYEDSTGVKKGTPQSASTCDSGPDSSPFGCKCETLSHKVLGDGCDICNPELAKELEEEMEQIRNESKLDALAEKVRAAGLDNTDYTGDNQ